MNLKDLAKHEVLFLLELIHSVTRCTDDVHLKKTDYLTHLTRPVREDHKVSCRKRHEAPDHGAHPGGEYALCAGARVHYGSAWAVD